MNMAAVCSEISGSSTLTFLVLICCSILIHLEPAAGSCGIFDPFLFARATVLLQQWIVTPLFPVR